MIITVSYEFEYPGEGPARGEWSMAFDHRNGCEYTACARAGAQAMWAALAAGREIGQPGGKFRITHTEVE